MDCAAGDCLGAVGWALLTPEPELGPEDGALAGLVGGVGAAAGLVGTPGFVVAVWLVLACGCPCDIAGREKCRIASIERAARRSRAFM